MGWSQVARTSANNVNSGWVSNGSYVLVQKLYIVGGHQKYPDTSPETVNSGWVSNSS
jgi:hypothetical protein